MYGLQEKTNYGNKNNRKCNIQNSVMVLLPNQVIQYCLQTLLYIPAGNHFPIQNLKTLYSKGFQRRGTNGRQG